MHYLSNNFLSFHHLSFPHIFSFIIFLLSTILHLLFSFLPQSISYSPLSNYCSISWTLSYFPVNTEEKFSSCLYQSSRFRWGFMFDLQDLCWRMKQVTILLWIFAVPFPEFSLAYNISPFYSFSRIHPPLLSYVSPLVSPGWLLKVYPFATNNCSPQS